MSCIQPIKRGDTFVVVCTYKEDGTATSVTPFTIRSQVRNARGELTQELTVTKADQVVSVGQFSLSAGAVTWNPGQYQCDIEFSNAGTVRSTQTFYIPVAQDITYG